MVRVLLALLLAALAACGADHNPAVVDRWEDTWPDGTLVQKELRRWNASPSGLALVQTFESGSEDIEHVETFRFQGRTAYRTESSRSHGEFYAVAPNGDLELWGEEGGLHMFRVAKRE